MEIDEFEGPLAGLIIAEVELAAEDEPVVLRLLGLEVTTATSGQPFPREARARARRNE